MRIGATLGTVFEYHQRRVSSFRGSNGKDDPT